MSAQEPQDPEIEAVTYEQLADIEREFDEADVETRKPPPPRRTHPKPSLTKSPYAQSPANTT